MHRIHGLFSLLTKDEKGKEPYSIFLCSHLEVVIVIIRKTLHKSWVFTYKLCCQVFISYECLRYYFQSNSCLSWEQVFSCHTYPDTSYYKITLILSRKCQGTVHGFKCSPRLLHLHYKALPCKSLPYIDKTPCSYILDMC